jgi:hypothetical protein
MSNHSEVRVGPQGVTAYVGPDATLLVSAMMLRTGIKMYRTCGMIPTRGMTITKMLERATVFSGKKYTRAKMDQAIADLTTWIEAMKSAIPIVER